jgi:phosphoglycolate phosphatase-like HAD superfamily hydrolase
MKRLGCQGLLALLLAIMASTMVLVPGHALADPLPSWRESATRQRILDFVAAVTTPGSPDYVTPAERIAVFDDDGTLWPEKPRPQGMLALQRLKARAGGHPEWRQLMPYRGALELGPKYLTEASHEDVMAILAAAFSGLTQDEFRTEVRRYFREATHPRWGVPYGRLVYQPMRELIGHLRANGFRVYIVTAGNLDVVRELAEDVFGLPAGDVIGGSVVTTLREEEGQLVVRRLRTVHALNDGDTKALSVDYHLGRRPLVAVGNVGTGGDVALLRYSQGRPASQGGRRTLQVLVVHDDFEREYAYEEADRASLNAAEKYGWTVTSMRFEWKRLFSFQDLPPASAPAEVPVAGVVDGPVEGRNP